jgi:hypothetical protein
VDYEEKPGRTLAIGVKVDNDDESRSETLVNIFPFIEHDFKKLVLTSKQIFVLLLCMLVNPDPIFTDWQHKMRWNLAVAILICSFHYGASVNIRYSPSVSDPDH